MFELEGEYNKAKVFTDHLESEAVDQIVNFLGEKSIKGSKVRIMPDAHKGAGSTIGTTMTILDTIVPNLVGVDIGCGLSVAIIRKDHADTTSENMAKLDKVIRTFVPNGRGVHDLKAVDKEVETIPFNNVKALFNLEKAITSFGSLGGGNHFIELNEYDDNHIALVVHSGSRGFGHNIATHYQKRAFEELTSNKDERKAIISNLKAQGREREIQEALQNLPTVKVDRELAYLKGESFDDYLNDMAIAQEYAEKSRLAMLKAIMTQMNWESVDSFSSVHNYIDVNEQILRKGAVSAQKNERLIIPINMRDGSIIARGKGNEDWNYSAPHGAGRVLSRTKAKALLDFDSFNESMADVWTTSVHKSTIDESPMAYKSMDDIMKHIGDTVEIERIIKPIYNFKASE